MTKVEPDGQTPLKRTRRKDASLERVSLPPTPVRRQNKIDLSSRSDQQGWSVVPEAAIHQSPDQKPTLDVPGVARRARRARPPSQRPCHSQVQTNPWIPGPHQRPRQPALQIPTIPNPSEARCPGQAQACPLPVPALPLQPKTRPKKSAASPPSTCSSLPPGPPLPAKHHNSQPQPS